jgi:hypothetical protein
MGFPTLEVGYTSATTGRGDHEVRKGHVVAMGEIAYTNVCLMLKGSKRVEDIKKLKKK